MPRVSLYANLQTVTGKKELSILVENIQEILGKLTQDYLGLVRFLFEKGKLCPRVIIKTKETTT
jgi:molybdopterin converting factor small subunit